jgi:hypothetical protein
MERRFFILQSDSDLEDGLNALNLLVSQGWLPIRETPMGGAGDTLHAYALILLERKR